MSSAWTPQSRSKAGSGLGDVEELHRAAMAADEWGYEDPVSGFMVMTSDTLRKRGKCCGNGCKHCPFGHMNVRDESRSKNLVRNPVLLKFAPRRRREDTPTKAHVLFFSGGKDSYLAYLRLRAEVMDDAEATIILLTSFAAHNGVVGHQQVPFREVIMAQARSLGVDVLAVPLEQDAAYEEQIRSALLLLSAEHQLHVESLCFGDLHLQDIRDWRIRSLAFDGPLEGTHMRFQIWQVGYDDLVERLSQARADVFVCAIGDNCPVEARSLVEIGARYDKDFVRRLRAAFPDIDAFGECGEFHTVVLLPGMDHSAVLDQIQAAREDGAARAS